MIKSISTFMTAAVMALSSQHVMARDAFYDYARVISAKPIVEEVEVVVPHRHCWEEDVVTYEGGNDYGSYTPSIVGGLLGGAIGSRVGKGNGRKVATIAGTLLGASIARDMQMNQPRRARRAHVETVEQCEVRNEYAVEEQVVGYRVKYRYHGQTFVTRMDRDPGDEIRLQVQFSAID